MQESILDQLHGSQHAKQHHSEHICRVFSSMAVSDYIICIKPALMQSAENRRKATQRQK